MLAEIKRSKLYLEEQIGPQLDIAKEIITKLNDVLINIYYIELFPSGIH